ncbi:DUF6976 family protein [Plastorhodobacter daqingensis]|uniref:DUF6976 family protein n=1 Tax=Plastorhodobacter daqingensis TaxID=1387281 RepID=A0ABW2UH63_9RHOB
MKNELLDVVEAAERIGRGDIMCIAGDEQLLLQLPKGRWIGGTTVYFVASDGGAVLRDKLFCTTLQARRAEVRYLPTLSLPEIPAGYIDGGATLILVPAFSTAHARFAVNGPGYPGLFDQPLLGWVTGVHLDELGSRRPKVVNGATGAVNEDGALLLHLELWPGERAELDIVNIFEPDDAVTFSFPVGGFAASRAIVEGAEVSFGTFLVESGADTRLPLIANYAGAHVNVSIRDIDHRTGEVSFYAPVVPGVEYRLACPVPDYAAAFARNAGGRGAAQFSCNCILNYIHGDLEGRPTGDFTGPVTFGEIAYILLNQTLVRLDIQAGS